MKNDLPDETSVSAFLDKNPTFLKSYLNNQVKTLSAKNSSIYVKRDESKLGQNIIDDLIRIMSNFFDLTTSLILSLKKSNL